MTGMAEPLIVDFGRATADGVAAGSRVFSDLDLGGAEIAVGDTIEVMDYRGEGSFEAEVVEVDGDTIRVQAPALKPHIGGERPSPELVDAGDLTRWADKEEAPYEFPRLVRRLLTGAPGIAFPSVRAGAGVYLRGWDGLVDCTADAPYVPAGLSVWEMGTGRDLGRKAREDYDKRTKNPRGVDLAETAFVFATPRRWPDKDEWARRCSEEGPWREVRVLDADDLEGWLESNYVVHVRVSEQLGRRPLEAESLDRWWPRWADQTDPVLPPALLLAGRRAEAEKLCAALTGPPKVTGVRAASREEALAFGAAALSTVKDDVSASPAAVVVKSLAVWDRCAASPGPAILIPPRVEGIDLPAAVRQGHPVLIPMGAGDVDGVGETILLPRIGRSEAREALEAAGASSDKADGYAVAARRSLLSLRRRISLHPATARPVWAQGGEAELLAALVLVGAWEQNNDYDRAAVERIADCGIEAVERRLQRWENTDDPPFRRSGGAWRLSSPEDAWPLLRSMITRDCLRRWREAALGVLGASGSAIEPPGGRFFAPFPGAARKWSADLRRGLAQGAVFLAAFDLPRPLDGLRGSEHAERMVMELLDQAGADSAGVLWRSLADVLPLLAEAAPDIFLRAVHRDAAGGAPLLAGMFTDAGEFTGSPHTGLLWALEVLCWSDRYLPSAMDALLRLAEIDPGGRTANRPLDSARRVLLPWLHQTSASIERRMDVLDGVVERHEKKGWELLLSLVALRGSHTHNINRPRFRDWMTETTGISGEESRRAAEAITIRALKKAGANPYLWAQLIEHIPLLWVGQREQVIDALESSGIEALDHGDRFVIWKSLNKLVGNRPDRKALQDRLSAAGLERLENIRTKIRPDTPEVLIQEHHELFDWHPERSDRERQDAVTSIYRSAGVGGLRDLSKEAVRPELIGASSADALIDLRAEEMLPLLNQEGPDRAFVMGWITRRAELDGAEWIERTADSLADLSHSGQALFFLSLSPDTTVWKILDQMPPSVQDQYWERVHSFYIPRSDFLMYLDKLLEHRQPWSAVEFLFSQISKDKKEGGSPVTSEMVERTILKLIESDMKEHPSEMYAFYLGSLLDYLDKHEPDSSNLADLELTLFSVLRRSDRPPTAIYRRLQAEPAEFVKLVCSVHRLPDEEPENDSSESTAPLDNAWSILKEWRTLPGADRDTGDIEHERLRAWVLEARRLLRERGRSSIGDQYIGELLSGAPSGRDGIWPAEPVRDLLEELASEGVEQGVLVGRLNSRGVTVRDPFEGGAQERDSAGRYSDWAQQVEAKRPSTGRVLRQLADSYEREARRHDEEAEALSDQD